MKRILATIGIAVGITATALAIPAKPTPVEFTQPDGSVINVQIRGDEHHHFYLSEDGYLLVNVDDAFYYGNVNDLGEIKASSLLARPAGLRTSVENEYLSKVDMQKVFGNLEATANTKIAERRAAIANANAARMAKAPGQQHLPGVGLFPGSSYPSKGRSKGLAILVEYKDKKFTVSDPNDFYNRMLNEPGFSDEHATGSAYDYFVACSNGAFRPDFDVYGPVCLPEKMSYYGENDAWGDDKRPAMLAIDGCQLLDDEVDFSQYDCDGDGYIDNVFIFYAGQGEADGGSANTIWPHSWQVTLYTSVQYVFDGVRLDKYACSNEWQGSAMSGSPTGVGTFCHEFSHVLGLPDEYDTAYGGSFTPGAWSALDYGPYNNDGRTPPLYSIFQRNALSWCEPVNVTGEMSVELHPIIHNAGLVIETENENEFFLLENRQKEGWDKYLPGHGMLIWHIAYNPQLWQSNSPNNNSTHQYIDIEEADNTKSESSRAGDAFPGTSNVTSFTDDTTPSMKSWSRQPLGRPITGIREENGIIYFDICGGAEEVTVVTGEIYNPEDDEEDPEVKPTLDKLTVEAYEPTDITESSFVASWKKIDDATDYEIELYQRGDVEYSTDRLNFTNGVNQLPNGWSTSSKSTYSSADNSGESAPSLRLTADGDFLKSPKYTSDIKSFKFWHKCNTAYEGNQLRVVLGDEEFLYDIDGSSVGTIEFPEVAPGAKQARIEFVRNAAGSLAIDDVELVYNERYEKLEVEGVVFGEYAVADTIVSVEISGLANNQEYYYVVRATDGELVSRPSAEMCAILGMGAGDGIADAAIDECYSIDRGAIVADGEVNVYGIDGRCIYRQCKGVLPVNPGMYIIEGKGKAAKAYIK